MTKRNVNTGLASDAPFHQAVNQNMSSQPWADGVLQPSIPVNARVGGLAMLNLLGNADGDGIVRRSNALILGAGTGGGSELVFSGVAAAPRLSAAWSSDGSFSVQGVLTAGSATVLIQGTDDPLARTNPSDSSIGWTTEATLTLSGANDVEAALLSGDYAYYRANVSALVTGPVAVRRGV